MKTKKISSQMYFWTMTDVPNLLSYGDFLSASLSCVCFANDRSIPSLLPTTFLKETETEVPRSLLLLYGLRFLAIPLVSERCGIDLS